MRKALILGVLALLLLTLVSCTAGPNELADVPDEDGDVAGFWQGLWNGIIAPITFVISLFSDKVTMYEVHNNGGWYDFGFLFGLSAAWGGGSSGAARARRRREDF